MSFEFKPVAIIHSPFKEKFGTPRQPGLIKQALFSLEVLSPYDCDEAFEELEGFSHLWIIFVFHKNRDRQWSPKVRPPRLGGNQRIGVFASRSPYRPNPIGLSAVELLGIRRDQGKLFIDIKGADLIDGTPVLDIKPYVPYADCITEAKSDYASTPPIPKLHVQFNDQVLKQISNTEAAYPDIQNFIRQVIELDPRPAYANSTNDKAQYGMKLLDFDVQWQIEEGDVVTVLSLNKI